MPQNTLIIPHILPLTFRPVNPVVNPAIVSRHPDKYLFADTVKPWFQPVQYYQPFQKTESIVLQMRSAVPLFLNVYNCYEVKIQSVPFVQKQRDRFNTQVFIWEISHPLASYNSGVYYFTLGVGTADNEPYVSEPIDVQVLHENTMLYQYGHSDYRQSVYFNTGIIMQLRLHSFMKTEPASISTIYNDQPMNAVILDDVPYQINTLYIGGQVGVPDSMGDKLNRILGCDFVMIDGIEYAKNKEAKLEKTTYERYPLGFYSIELMPSLNRDGNVFIEEVQIMTKVVAAASVETKGFQENGNNGIIQIQDVI